MSAPSNVCYIYKCCRRDTREVFYVGSTRHQERMNYFLRYDQPYFLCVVLEAGLTNCFSEVIEICSEEDRFDREAYWTCYYLEKFDLVNRTIANNRYTQELRKAVFNEEVRQKMREAWSDERRKQQAERSRAMMLDLHMWEDADRLNRMKESVKAYWTNERRNERSKRYSGANNPMYNVPRPDMEGQSNYFYDLHLTGELNGMYGKHHSLEVRSKISESIKAKFKEDNMKEKLEASRRKAVESRKMHIRNLTIPISEIFLSIQGEGPNSGKPAVFVRTFGCPLTCSYCDSQYACKGSEFKHMTVDEIINNIREIGGGCSYVCLTGGEPLLSENVPRLLTRLGKEKIYTDVETCGAIDIAKFRKGDNPYVHFIVDYKCPSSNMEHKMLPDAFYALSTKDALKFVAGSDEDLVCALNVIDRYSPKCPIYFSPVFGYEASKIVDFMLAHHLYQCKVQLQMHKYIFDPNARGV